METTNSYLKGTGPSRLLGSYLRILMVIPIRDLVLNDQDELNGCNWYDIEMRLNAYHTRY
jgi:hypothetical protein